MIKKKYALALYSQGSLYSNKKVFTLEEISQETELHPSFVRRCLELGIVVSQAGGESLPLFDEDAIYRLRRIRRIREDLGINLMGAGIISDLVDEIEALKGEIERLSKDKGG